MDIFFKFCTSLLGLTSFQITSRPVLVSEKISQKCENASGFWIKVESRTYIYLDFYARCFYPGKFASFIFKYLRGISNWFQSGGEEEDWGWTQGYQSRTFSLEIWMSGRMLQVHTHTHTTPHMINLVAGRWYQSNILPDLRIRKKYNDSPHLRRPEVYYILRFFH